MKLRDTYRYVLRDGRKIVQFGISNGPRDRLNEHENDGKRFTTMAVVGPAVTREAALAWERKRIESYQQSHGGKKPQYNKI